MKKSTAPATEQTKEASISQATVEQLKAAAFDYDQQIKLYQYKYSQVIEELAKRLKK